MKFLSAFLIASFCLISLSANAQDRCEALFSIRNRKPSELTQVKKATLKLMGEDHILNANANTLFKSRGEESKQLLENSIEVDFFEASPFGHAYLRIGDRRLSFDMPGIVRFETYDPATYVRSGHFGALIFVSKKRIQKLLPEILRFYTSASLFNVPPMDSYAPEVELIKDPKGSWQFQTPSTGYYAAKSDFFGIPVLDGPNPHIATVNGLEIPLIVKPDGRIYVQSYSCSSSVSYILEQFFGVRIMGVSAMLVGAQILSGKLGPVIDYNRGPN